MYCRFLNGDSSLLDVMMMKKDDKTTMMSFIIHFLLPSSLLLLDNVQSWSIQTDRNIIHLKIRKNNADHQ